MDDELKRLVANKLFASNKIETGSWALALVLNILGLPAEPAAILHRAGTSSPMTETDVLRAGRHFPIKIKAVSSSAKRLDSTHFPGAKSIPLMQI
jgi:ABC-type bacteriocin/lantibiotic exporter with double-glycine peptidase domain